MLSTEDKKEIREIVVESLGEFFDHILTPYFDEDSKQTKKEHEKIRKDIESLRVEMNDKAEVLSEYIKDHENRIEKLEAITTIKN